MVICRVVGLAVAGGLVVGCSAILGLGDGSIAGSDGGAVSTSRPDGSGSGGDGNAPPAGDDATTPPAGDDGAAPPKGDDATTPRVPCDGGPGTCLSFTPGGGLPADDLKGDGLTPFTLGSTDAGGTGDAAAAGQVILDVDNGAMTTAGGVVVRAASAGDPTVRDVQAGIAYRQTSNNLAVVTFGSLTIPAGTTLKLVGIHAVALVSSTTMHIDGMVDVRAMSADGSVVCAGMFPSSGDVLPQAPGGYVGGAGQVQGHQGFNAAATAGMGPGGGGPAVQAAAGGGAGHATSGGAGCAGADAGTCGTAGAAYDAPALDTNGFRGGSGGGGGGVFSGEYQSGGNGGNGGGAVRFVAATSIEVSGTIDASGCGGNVGSESGGSPPAVFSSGGGGGSGGAIVIEAPAVTIAATSVILALGGAGGSAAGAGGTSSLNRGCYESLLSESHAGAGAGATPTATVDASAQTGAPPDCAGGGGYGWVRINAGGGNPAIASGARLDPDQASAAMTVGALAP